MVEAEHCCNKSQGQTAKSQSKKFMDLIQSWKISTVVSCWLAIASMGIQVIVGFRFVQT